MSLHHHSIEPSSKFGMVIGFITGAAKGVAVAVESTNLSWMSVTDAVVLAAVGAVVGWCVTTGLNWLRKKIKG